MLAGCCMMYMAAMLVATAEFVSDRFVGPLCQVDIWFGAIGVQLIYSTLFMRLLRIYKIFFTSSNLRKLHGKIWSDQGRIEPPKAARGHATYIDGKMPSVTKYSFQIYFRFHTCNDASAIANRWKWLISRPSVRLRRRLSVPAGNRRSLGYRRYFTAIENDRVSIRRAVVESGECSSCFRRYFR